MSHPDPNYAHRSTHGIPANMDPLGLVELALNIYINRANAGLVNRRDHPSYGYGKTAIRSDLDKADALLTVLTVMKGDSMNVTNLYDSDEVKERYPQYAKLRYLRRWVNSKSEQTPPEES
jgi:hypothetical protein